MEGNMSSKYTTIKTTDVGAPYKGSVSVNNIRTHKSPKKRK